VTITVCYNFVNEEQLKPKPSLIILDGIDGQTRLTRYMSLPTFLLLLAGRVFIPTLTKLREADRLESNVPKSALSDYWKNVEEMFAPAEDWLINLALRSGRHVAVRSSKSHLIKSWYEHKFGTASTENWPPQDSTDQPHNPQTMATLIEVWLDELAKRRCIWCWNKEEEESHALWRQYGNKGIAIVSSVNRIFESLTLPGRASCSVSEVTYIPNPFGEDKRSVYPSAYQKLISSTYLPRPYYFKEIGYRYEHEVRFVFANDALLLGLGAAPGVLAQINLNRLIESVDDVRISPHVLKDEAQVIQKLIERSLGENRSIDLTPDLSFPSANFTDPPISPFEYEGFILDASPPVFRQFLSSV
jgi:hypothetical protein